MNHGRPSRSRLLRTLPSLNHTLPVQQSLKHLVSPSNRTQTTTIQGTEADVAKIKQFLLEKLQFPDMNELEEANWTKTAFYTPTTALPRMGNPIVKLNSAFTKVEEWVGLYGNGVITEVTDEELTEQEDTEII